MREIEVLVKCDNTLEELKLKFNKYNFTGEKSTIDTYYYDELRSNLKPGDNLRLNECFRIREKAGKAYMTYKVDNFTEDDIWLYSDEFETEILDANMGKKIVSKLGLKELIKIDNTKYTYETEEYYVFVEDVEKLGTFVEVEIKTDSDEAVEIIKNKIRDFIKSHNLKNIRELNEGKPEMMLKYEKNHQN